MENLEKYNIILIGDSITKGLYLDNGEIKKTKQNAVDIINSNFNCQIKNFSIFGQTLKRVMEKNLHQIIIEKNFDKNKKNILVVSLGGNDSDYDWQAVAQSPQTMHDNNTPLNDFKSYLQKIIEETKNLNVDIAFTALFPIDSKRYFENFISKNNDGKIIKKFLSGDITNLNRNQESFNIAVMQGALENHCKFIDIRTPLLQTNNFLKYLSKDGIHPNLLGQQKIAQITSDYIRNYIEKGI